VSDDVSRGCECTSCTASSRCAGEDAPVAYLVQRGQKQIHVCTRCELSSDTRVRLLVNEDTPVGPYMDYDPLGGLCLFGEVLTDE